MSPAPKLQKRGEDLGTATVSFTESYPATWASEVIEPLTAVNSVSRYSTAHTDYTVITTDGVATAVPIATAASSNSTASSGSSNHLALAVALPISLFVACAFVVALYIHRFKSRREQERRRATWSQRLNWIPDSKVRRDDVDASTSQAFDAPTPLSPIQTVPASYPGHSRQDSTFA